MTRGIVGWLTAVGLLLGLAAAAAAQPHRVALLVGISEYANPAWHLDGPANDVAAMRSVLERRWRVKAADIRTLVDREATRAAILEALRELQRRSAAGDEVVIYLSGHGTSAFAGESGAAVPYGSGAFVPYDFRDDAPQPAQGLIVGRTDLRPLLLALEAGGRRLWVISDSCYSGQQVRGVRRADPLPARMIPAPSLRVAEALAAQPPLPATTEPYPYRQTVYLAAAAEGETAKDISRKRLADYPTLDGQPHGAMTDALLRVLEGQLPSDADRDGSMSLDEVHRAVAEFMSARGYGHGPQRLPSVAEDALALGARPVLSVTGAAAAPREAPPSPLRALAEGLPGGLLQRIGGLPDIQLVARGAAFDLALRADATALAFASPAGDTIATVPLADVDRIVGQLRQLAWARRIDQRSLAQRRAVLPMEIEPATLGGNFMFGSKVSLVVRPDREATLLLINVDSGGRVSVLYPFASDETGRLRASQAQYIPRRPERLEVQPPEGMDMQFAWAFDEPPAGLEKLRRLTGLDAADPRLAALEPMLTRMAGKYAYARTELRAFMPR